jgi:hypothetical protein
MAACSLAGEQGRSYTGGPAKWQVWRLGSRCSSPSLALIIATENRVEVELCEYGWRIAAHETIEKIENRN